jgi:DNA-binding NarL/FixJ family response regulator
MAVSVEADTVFDTLPDPHNTCVYRVVQEALHNCTRHAHARTVRIRVRQEPGKIVLSVQDDGKGFDAHHVRGLGLLTAREREILQLLAEGKANKEVAAMLNLSIYTVETHRTHILQKLNLHNVPELILYAVRKGIIA